MTTPTILDRGQTLCDPQVRPAPVDTSGLATDDSMPTEAPPAQPLDGGHRPFDSQRRLAPVDPLGLVHSHGAPQGKLDQADLVRSYNMLSPGYAELRLWAEMLSDTQDQRIRLENRVRSATVEPMPYLIHVGSMRTVEHQVALDLRRAYRRVAPPGVREWQKNTLGIGEHLLARLLGALGHPRLTAKHAWAENPKFDAEKPSSEANPKRILTVGEPFLRTESQLRQYCGHGSPDRRQKGMTQDDALGLGSPRCKMLVHLLAESCLKSGGYRDVYDETKDKYLAKEFTKGHAHNCALRMMGKRILGDLWEVSAL